MCADQLYLFGIDCKELRAQKETVAESTSAVNTVSENLRDSFETYDIPFIGCDFNVVYPEVLSVIPQEIYTFDHFDLDTAIMCEVVCAAICHQINWDILREAVLKYTQRNSGHLSAGDLQFITEDTVLGMLGHYKKKGNIKAGERAKMLRSLGKWAGKYSQIRDVFLTGENKFRSINAIKEALLKCPVFSSDPEEKKLNLLLQKLNLLTPLSGIGQYAKPAIDYHLLRLYLRRGLIYARTKYAYDYISNPDISRKENTVAALRELCSKLLCQIALSVGLDITSVNLVEWHVARSVCDRDNPDCDLIGVKAKWLKPKYMHCPFCATCIARNTATDKLLTVKEPSYKGTSY